jgi:hypothetical protein
MHNTHTLYIDVHPLSTLGLDVHMYRAQHHTLAHSHEGRPSQRLSLQSLKHVVKLRPRAHHDTHTLGRIATLNTHAE